MAPNEIKKFYDENGYYVARGVFSPDEVKVLERDFDRIVSQIINSGERVNARWGGDTMNKLDGGESVIFHTHNVQTYSAAWLQACLHKTFLDVTEALIGPDIILHHTKLFQKPSEKGSPFPMHQDWTYFPSCADSMLAGVIHVSNATDEMGCLRVYPESHKLGRIQGTNGQSYNEVLEQYPLEGSTPVECEPGDVVFFSYLTLHGSKPNRSNSIRKTVLVQMHSGQDKIEDSNRHPYSRLVLRGWNHTVRRSTATES